MAKNSSRTATLTQFSGPKQKRKKTKVSADSSQLKKKSPWVMVDPGAYRLEHLLTESDRAKADAIREADGLAPTSR